MQILLIISMKIKKRKFFRGADACIGSLFFCSALRITRFFHLYLRKDFRPIIVNH